MQKLVPEPHSRLLRPVRRGHTLRTLSLWAALCGLGTTLGCGSAPAVSPIDNADSVQNNLTPMCLTETQGATTSCKDEMMWSSYAAMACASKGLMMTKISYATSCGMGLYRQTTYECCSGTTPTPPMPMCMWTPAIPGPTVCRSDADWKKEGTTYCAAHGLQLSDLKLEHPCTAGGHATAQYECCTPTTMPPPPPPPTTMCVADSLASMTCVDDATWKSKAEAECKTKMLTLGTLAPGAACMGGHLDIKFECCGTTTTPPPPPPMCSTEKAPSTSMCQTPDQWKVQGDAFCTAKHETLSGLTLNGACMGGFSDAQFVCCPATTTPPPPPPTCTAGALGDGKTCATEADLKSQAEAVCKMAGATLSGFATYDTCAMTGSFLHAKYQCCK